MSVKKEYKRLYKIWQGMKQRCTNVKDKDYIDYGGRGIQVCIKWLDSFIDFKNWSMINGYSEELTIDRIDFNGNYEPKNCRWATWTTQARNKRIAKNNKSGCKGVCMDSHAKKWRATIYVKKSKIHIGVFEKLDDAIEARKQAELLYWNETA